MRRGVSSLILRRSVAPKCLPFELSKSDALKSFGDWARIHEAAKDSGTFVLGGWKQQEGVQLEAHAMPWWCFDVHDRDAWPTTQRKYVYAGIDHDAVSLQEALSEALDNVTGAKPFDPDDSAAYAYALASTHKLGMPITVEAAALTAGTAWEAARAEHVGNLDSAELRSVALLWLPAWRVRYTYLGVPLTAWVCGRTGLADGINCRGLGLEFFEHCARAPLAAGSLKIAAPVRARCPCALHS